MPYKNKNDINIKDQNALIKTSIVLNEVIRAYM